MKFTVEIDVIANFSGDPEQAKIFSALISDVPRNRYRIERATQEAARKEAEQILMEAQRSIEMAHKFHNGASE